MKAQIVLKGGPGSGHRGHAGIPGKRGGSLPGTGGGYSFRPGELPGKRGGEKNEEITQRVDREILSKGLPSSRKRQNVYVWEGVTHQERADVKDDIITSLSTESGVNYNTTNDIVGQWAMTSNDTDYRSLSLQEAASEEFNVPLSGWQQQTIARQHASEYKMELLEADPPLSFDQMSQAIKQKFPIVEDPYSVMSWRMNKPITSRENERAVLRTMYNQTQETFRKAGFQPDDVITLYRGYNSGLVLQQYKPASYQGNAMESWSISSKVAYNFGKTVIAMNVPVRNIVGTCRTGFGCLEEGEFVVIGSIPGQEALVMRAE